MRKAYDIFEKNWLEVEERGTDDNSLLLGTMRRNDKGVAKTYRCNLCDECHMDDLGKLLVHARTCRRAQKRQKERPQDVKKCKECSAKVLCLRNHINLFHRKSAGADLLCTNVLEVEDEILFAEKQLTLCIPGSVIVGTQNVQSISTREAAERILAKLRERKVDVLSLQELNILSLADIAEFCQEVADLGFSIVFCPQASRTRTQGSSALLISSALGVPEVTAAMDNDGVETVLVSCEKMGAEIDFLSLYAAPGKLQRTNYFEVNRSAANLGFQSEVADWSDHSFTTCVLKLKEVAKDNFACDVCDDLEEMEERKRETEFVQIFEYSTNEQDYDAWHEEFRKQVDKNLWETGTKFWPLEEDNQMGKAMKEGADYFMNEDEAQQEMVKIRDAMFSAAQEGGQHRCEEISEDRVVKGRTTGPDYPRVQERLSSLLVALQERFVFQCMHPTSTNSTGPGFGIQCSMKLSRKLMNGIGSKTSQGWASFLFSPRGTKWDDLDAKQTWRKVNEIRGKRAWGTGFPEEIVGCDYERRRKYLKRNVNNLKEVDTISLENINKKLKEKKVAAKPNLEEKETDPRKIVETITEYFRNKPFQAYKDMGVTPTPVKELNKKTNNLTQEVNDRRAKEPGLISWPLTLLEFRAAVSGLETGRTCGHDRTSHEMMRALRGSKTELVLFQVYRVLLARGAYPRAGRIIKIAPVGKLPVPVFLEMLMRPVSICSVFAKVYDRIIDRRACLLLDGKIRSFHLLESNTSKSDPATYLTRLCAFLGIDAQSEVLKARPPAQPGFSVAYRKGFSKELACVILLDHIFSKEECVLLLSDCMMGFDVVDHISMLEAFDNFGAPDEFQLLIGNFLRKRKLQVKDGTKWLLSPGKPQGKIMMDITIEMQKLTNIRDMRISKKIDIVQSCLYPAFSANTVPIYPYFKSSTKRKLTNTITRALKKILGLPARCPSYAVFWGTGLAEPSQMMFVEAVACFARGVALGVWEFKSLSAEPGPSYQNAQTGSLVIKGVPPLDAFSYPSRSEDFALVDSAPVSTPSNLNAKSLARAHAGLTAPAGTFPMSSLPITPPADSPCPLRRIKS
eukprot:g4998.t1